jgi:hypothetical protein
MSYTRDRLSDCQTETERLNVLAFIRLEEKEKAIQKQKEKDRRDELQK